ncbi:MAG: hypothetical protein ACP5VE_10160 [Chthonomonadales bacterium]
MGARRAAAWLIGLAVLLLGILCTHPSTGWIARVCWSYAVAKSPVLLTAARSLGIRSDLVRETPNAAQEVVSRVLMEAERRADNPADALFVAQYDPRTGHWRPPREALPFLERLAEGFPERPEPAAALCVACTDILRFDREAEQAALSAQPSPIRSFQLSPLERARNEQTLEMLLRAARRGKRADPGNGFFPSMLSVALFAGHRDQEALEALHRAGGSARWDDYVFIEPAEHMRLQQLVFGRQPAVVSELERAAVLLPHLGRFREAIRVALYHAVRAEQQGDYRTGLAIRKDIAQCAMVMGRSSRTMIQALVAAALTTTAATWPAGRVRLGGSRLPPDELARRREAAFLGFVRTQEGPASAAWFASQIRNAHEVREVARAAAEHGAFEPPYRAIAIGWSLGAAMLACCLWCLGMAVLTQILLRTRKEMWQIAALGLIAIGSAAWLARCVYANVAILTMLSDVYGLLEASAKEGWVSHASLMAGAAGTLVVLGSILPAVIGVLAGKFTSAGMMRGAALGLAAAAFGYCLACGLVCVLIVRQENRTVRILQQMHQSELVYAARLLGKPVPWQAPP